MDIDKRNLSIIERLEELRDLMKIGMDKVTLQDAMDEIERLREAAKDRPKDRPNDAANKIEHLREENQKLWERLIILNDMIQTEHEIIRVAALKEGE